MGDFFHGWRRKAGVVTLVLACVFMAWWVHSKSCRDLPNWSSSLAIDLSLRFGRLALDPVMIDPSKTPVKAIYDHGEPLPITDKQDLGLRCIVALHQLGFVFCCEIPFGSVVLPLTLLSAYLLLTKPRKANPKKTAEPTPAAGA